MLHPVKERRYHDPLFTEQKVREIRLQYLRTKSVTFRDLAEEHGTSHVTIRKIITGADPYDYA